MALPRRSPLSLSLLQPARARLAQSRAPPPTHSPAPAFKLGSRTHSRAHTHYAHTNAHTDAQARSQSPTPHTLRGACHSPPSTSTVRVSKPLAQTASLGHAACVRTRLLSGGGSGAPHGWTHHLKPCQAPHKRRVQSSLSASRALSLIMLSLTSVFSSPTSGGLRAPCSELVLGGSLVVVLLLLGRHQRRVRGGLHSERLRLGLGCQRGRGRELWLLVVDLQPVGAARALVS